VQLLRGVDSRGVVPTNPRTAEQQMFFDAMWADPHDGVGLQQSGRGEGCIQFGTDTTAAFLRRSKLELLLRSHEVPRTLRGYAEQAGGKCITVFSASNYCGSSGNLGGVVILDAKADASVWEYMAPSLAEQAALHAGDAREATDSGRLERGGSHGDKKRQTAAMDEQIVAKLKELIVEKRDELWWYYSQHDALRRGRVSIECWRDGLESVLQLSQVPLVALQPRLCDVDRDESLPIDYNRFLDRYILVQQADEAVEPADAHSGWQAEVVRELYEAVLRADLSLRNTLALFDSDGDGTVSTSEFAAVCEECRLGISAQQARQLLRAITADDGSGRLDVGRFLERFQVLYVESRGLERASVHERAAPWAEDLLRRIGHSIVHSGATAVETFQKYDRDGSGFLEHPEFADAVRALDQSSPAAARRPRSPLDRGRLAELAALVDKDGNGRINILEFCAAFVVDDGRARAGEPAVEDEAADGGAALGRQLSNGIVQVPWGVGTRHHRTM
jgi:protein phosphatase